MTIAWIHPGPRAAQRLRMIVALALGMIGFTPSQADTTAQKPVAQRMADATIERWPKGQFLTADKPWKWNYELGTLLEGMDAVWYDTADGAYYRYIKDAVDPFISADGAISTYDPSAYSQ